MSDWTTYTTDEAAVRRRAAVQDARDEALAALRAELVRATGKGNVDHVVGLSAEIRALTTEMGASR